MKQDKFSLATSESNAIGLRFGEFWFIFSFSFFTIHWLSWELQLMTT